MKMPVGDRDIPYRAVDILHEPFHHDLRLAVIYPALRLKKNKKQKWSSTCRELLALWRTRAGDFYRTGLPAFANIGHVRNCLPSSFLLNGDYRSVLPCHLNNVCPWCWMRCRKGLYEQITGCHQATDLLVYGYFDEYLSIEECDASRLHFELGVRSARALALVRGNRNDLKGGYWTITVEPALARDRHGCWKLTTRLLTLFPEGKRMFLAPRGRPLVNRGPSDMGDVRKAIRTVLRYPAGLLRGPTQMAKIALMARSDLLLAGCVGSFRKPRQRKEV